MKYHPLPPATCCPFCGLALLVYSRPGHHGDIYKCAVDRGGCGRTVVHHREKGGTGCGVRPVMNFGMFGKWQACELADDDQ